MSVAIGIEPLSSLKLDHVVDACVLEQTKEPIAMPRHTHVAADAGWLHPGDQTCAANQMQLSFVGKDRHFEGNARDAKQCDRRFDSQ